MCAVSMITDHYRDLQQWQQPHALPAIQWPPALPPTLPWTREAVDEFKEIIKRLDALDKKLGLEHCEDPKKAEWMQAIEARLKALETKAECAG